jgi:hypothetical protein
MSETTRRQGALRSPALWLYLVIPVLYCGWVFSMPVFPSQDGPLHLYLAEIFRQLLAHTPGVYSDTYFVKHYLPPYSLYYYSLAGLGTLFSMEVADKLIVCCFFLVFALGVRALCRVVSGDAEWAPFLALPVLINWPLMMGFVNYSLGTGFACFALAIWCRNVGKSGIGRRIGFLALLVVIILTHPVPWMFVVGFALFDLGLRMVRYRLVKDRTKARSILDFFRLDLGAALIGCLGYFYLRYFQNAPVPPEPLDHPHVHYTYLQIAFFRAMEYLRTRGLTVFSGTHGAPLVYRLTLCFLFGSALFLGMRHSRRMLRSGRWTLTETWMTFGLLFLLAMPFIPSDLNGSFFFAWRLMVLLYLSIVIAASGGMRDNAWPAMVLALVAAGASIFNLDLAFRYISPVARDIATLWTAPVVSTDKPGMMIRLQEADYPPSLNYDPLASAAAHYFRRNNLLLFNTSWVNLSIIPVQPRADHLHLLDERFIINTPHLGMTLMKTPDEAKRTLSRVGYVITLPPSDQPVEQNPFAAAKGGTSLPAYAAGWGCINHRTWDICTPQGR